MIPNKINNNRLKIALNLYFFFVTRCIFTKEFM